jgi:hypothetical protein
MNSSHTCQASGQSFPITDKDRDFYKKMGVSEPTLCPEERRRRRLAIRNEIHLYNRKCDKTGRSIISMYAPNSPYVIYDVEEWHKDDWDPMEHGRDFDFSRPFFEQFAELQKVVPRLALNCIGNENASYTNYALRNKDSYLIYTADFNEKCYYLRFADRNYQCMDSDFTYDSRFCIGLLHAENVETCFYSQKIKNSSGLYFCYNLQNCHDCMFTTNAQNKQYMMFNKQLTKEEYAERKENLGLDTAEGFGKAMAYFKDIMGKTPRKHLENKNCEDSVGDYLVDCKDVEESYDCFRCRDVKFATHLYEANDCYDWDFVGYKSELCYEIASSAYQLINCRFSMHCWEGNTNLTYCELTFGSKDLFGCVGLRKGQYCILNKQYSKEEYETLVQKIIEHMKETGEWGEFFPIGISTFGYNESVAFEYFPLTKEEALTLGYKWHDEDESAAYQGPEIVLPESINEANQEEVCSAILRCTKFEKLYKIIPQEFVLYKKFGIALPRLSPMARHEARMGLRNSRTLYDRECGKCGVGLKTSYAPDRPEPIYCESCYLKEVY